RTMVNALERDPALAYKFQCVSAEEVRRNQGLVRRGIIQVIRDLRAAYVDSPPDLSMSQLPHGEGEKIWRIRLEGRCAISGFRITWPGEIPEGLRVRVACAQGETESEYLECESVSTRSIDLPVPLVGGLEFVPNLAAQTYRERGAMAPSAYTVDIAVQATNLSGVPAPHLGALLLGGEEFEIPVVEGLQAMPANGQFNILPTFR
ncbi:MAG: hypothetical protein KDB61_09970, partial [Planctomycetes bacterium]|nr:hypothetical protein [Planctomycetota bacterium]